MKKDTMTSHHSNVCSCWSTHDLLNQLTLILVGVVLLMVNTGYLDREIIAYWPLLLVVWGLREVLSHR